jgi:membrane associated rhomboid family serine protease
MKNQTETPQKEPLLNIPPFTLWLGIILLGCFGALQNGAWFDRFVPLLSFIPQQFTADPLQHLYTILTYAFLHFSWAHIGANLAGLIAFGSGTERLLSRKNFCFIFLGGVILGALGHWALFPHDSNPLGGASAGISALFGAVLPLMLDKRRDLIIASGIFILTNILFGTMGMPNSPGMVVAWQAHIFGFLFGMIFVFILMKMKRHVSEEPRSALAEADEA